MPRWLKITGIGCGGLLGLFILVGACTAIITGPTDETAQEEAAEQGQPVGQEEPVQEQGQQQEPVEEQPVAQIGQSVPVGEWSGLSLAPVKLQNSVRSSETQSRAISLSWISTSRIREMRQ